MPPCFQSILEGLCQEHIHSAVVTLSPRSVQLQPSGPGWCSTAAHSSSTSRGVCRFSEMHSETPLSCTFYKCDCQPPTSETSSEKKNGPCSPPVAESTQHSQTRVIVCRGLIPWWVAPFLTCHSHSKSRMALFILAWLTGSQHAHQPQWTLLLYEDPFDSNHELFQHNKSH